MKAVLRYVIASLIIFVISCQSSPTSDVKQLELAANQGDTEAMFELGEMYENGVGVIQNYVEAHKWYNIATSRGYVKAHKARVAIAKKMVPQKIAEAQDLAANWKPSKSSGAKAKAEERKQTPLEKLFEATREGDASKVKSLLDSGVDPNIEIGSGAPILMVAVHEGHKPVVEILVDAGASINTLLKKERTLLMIAIKAGHRDIAKFLIEKGAKLDVKSSNGDTPLSLAEAKGLDDIVALIMKTGGFVEPVKTLPPETIFRAAENGDMDMLRKLLDQGVDPNMKDRKGWFPLMFAAYSGHKEAVEALIEAGAEIDKQAPDGSTALITATLQGNVLVVKTLLNKGADKSAKNSLGMTALTVAKQKGYAGIAELMSGSINVKSYPPSASISLEGKYESTTPATIAYLVPGRYRVEIKKNGYKTWSDTVSVSVGKETGVFAQLKKELPLSSYKLLRSSYKELDYNGVKTMLKKYNFFDKYKNKTGGFKNDYELKMFGGSEVVIDNATGLMWHQSGSDKYMDLWEAAQWVKDLNKMRYAGNSDWRLPTVEEAASLLESSKNNNDLYIDSIFNKKQSHIWTCDSVDGWKVYLSFREGHVDWSRFKSSSSGCVRPVRSGK